MNIKKIAFIGNFCHKKGSKIFKEIVLYFKNKYEWYIFGGIGDQDSFESIKKYIKHYGFYEDGQLENLIKKNKIDLCLLLSIWPETFSKTFFQVLKTKTPFISFNLGFSSFLFKDYPYFLNLDNKSFNNLISTIKDLTFNLNKLNKIKKIIKTKIYPLIEEKNFFKKFNLKFEKIY